MLHASAAFLEVLLELLEDRGGANHIIQSWDTSTCVIEVFFRGSERRVSTRGLYNYLFMIRMTFFNFIENFRDDFKVD